jgi:hypothetical protein
MHTKQKSVTEFIPVDGQSTFATKRKSIEEYVHVHYRCGHSDIKLIGYYDEMEKKSKLKNWAEHGVCLICGCGSHA